MTFKEKYLQLKDEGFSDRQVAGLMQMSKERLLDLKKTNKVFYHVRTTRNKTGLTQKELNIALRNGLTTKLAIRRVREGGWSVRDAINTPKGKRPDSHYRYHGKTEEEIRLEKSEQQKEYYKMRKLKVLRG